MKLLLVIIGILSIFLLVYAILPTILIRINGWGIKKRIQSDAIAITFDDGPNPIYTPLLLDLLKKYGVKATFFVVGSKVKRYPEIIKRMSEEGHTIGIHHFQHVSSWICSPFRLKKQLTLTEQAISDCTNERVTFYRPPWGHFNLFSLFVSKPYKKIMWSHIFGDWKTEKGKNGLREELLAATEPGSILLLHDCGETLGADQEAPGLMIKNLEIYLKEAIDQGTKFMTLKEI
ncbi:polysaccharide deacetylase family protein [Neobacillus cucumis]|uniref:Polysaccharide deacetylase family protein n=1 Tax=Neobacillus cucumis TaxID=1740721 RepID=A0A2N5HF45_9BACI|nr:polysaccharide deacetylase family protein [Neobacillus cucumis]PLS04158.1 polysaccharide deacetylase family protein [Neobacillus cucumis]